MKSCAKQSNPNFSKVRNNFVQFFFNSSGRLNGVVVAIKFMDLETGCQELQSHVRLQGHNENLINPIMKYLIMFDPVSKFMF